MIEKENLQQLTVTFIAFIAQYNYLSCFSATYPFIPVPFSPTLRRYFLLTGKGNLKNCRAASNVRLTYKLNYIKKIFKRNLDYNSAQ